MLVNDQKFHLRKINKADVPRQNKKFNTKGYFVQVPPFDQNYLKKKHQAYQKHHELHNKQNFVYNLSEKRIPIGIYQMKGCCVEAENTKKNRRVLKTLNENNEERSLEHYKTNFVKFQRVISSLLKKYMNRKQRLKNKSQRSLTSVFEQVRPYADLGRSNSQQTSHLSYKLSQQHSRVSNQQNCKQKKRMLLTHKNNYEDEMKNCQIVTACREKIRSRKLKMKTLQC